MATSDPDEALGSFLGGGEKARASNTAAASDASDALVELLVLVLLGSAIKVAMELYVLERKMRYSYSEGRRIDACCCEEECEVLELKQQIWIDIHRPSTTHRVVTCRRK